MKTILLAIDETTLYSACIRWTIKTCVSKGDTLYIASCSPQFTTARTSFQPKKAAHELSVRLKATVEIIKNDLKRSDFNYKVDVSHYKLEQPNHVLTLVESLKPSKLIIYLNEAKRPLLSRWTISSVSNLIKANAHCNSIILCDDMIRKLDDADVWNVGLM